MREVTRREVTGLERSQGERGDSVSEVTRWERSLGEVGHREREVHF